MADFSIELINLNFIYGTVLAGERSVSWDWNHSDGYGTSQGRPFDGFTTAEGCLVSSCCKGRNVIMLMLSGVILGGGQREIRHLRMGGGKLRLL